jgi:hypothetical protein
LPFPFGRIFGLSLSVVKDRPPHIQA